MKVKRVATSWVAWLAALSAVAAVLPSLIEAEYPDVTWLGTVRIGAAVAIVLIGKLTYDKSTPAKDPVGTLNNVKMIPDLEALRDEFGKP
jgi:hypothetical protein